MSGALECVTVGTAEVTTGGAVRAEALGVVCAEPLGVAGAEAVDATRTGRCANGPQTCQPRFDRIEIAAPAPIATTTKIRAGAYHRRDDISRSR